MFHLKDFIGSINSISTYDLKKIQSAVKSELLEREKHKRDFVEHFRDFSDKETLDAVWSDCQSLVLSDSKRKTASQWLSPINEPYIYHDSNPIHNAIDITQFNGISKLLHQLNSDPRVSGPLDSCLILKYNSNIASTGLHADDEDYLDQNKSICDFSIGSTRTLEFFDKTPKSRPVTNFVLTSNSVVHTKPGTQQLMKHMVRSEVGGKSAEPEKDLWYSLSFSGLTKLRSVSGSPNTTGKLYSGNQIDADVNFEPQHQDTTSAQNQQQHPPQQPEAEYQQQQPQHISLVAGDSYAARLDTKLLGRGYLTVKSVAKGGATINKVKGQLEEFVVSNSNVIVDKLLISVGTNDIRYCNNGIDHLRGPLKQLCVTIRELFPKTKIFFQSLLPLPCLNKYDWNTNTNVIEFNRLLFNECVYRRFCLMNTFVKFIRPCMNIWCPHLRNDKLFPPNDIHPNDKIGISILAKEYIRALHSNYFDPYVFQ